MIPSATLLASVSSEAEVEAFPDGLRLVPRINRCGMQRNERSTFTPGRPSAMTAPVMDAMPTDAAQTGLAAARAPRMVPPRREPPSRDLPILAYLRSIRDNGL